MGGDSALPDPAWTKQGVAGLRTGVDTSLEAAEGSSRGLAAAVGEEEVGHGRRRESLAVAHGHQKDLYVDGGKRHVRAQTPVLARRRV